MRRVKVIFPLLLAFVALQFSNAGAQTAPQLSAEQLIALKQVKTDSEKKALPFAMDLAVTAKAIYENMLAEKEDQQKRRKLNVKLHNAAGHLLDIKGESFRRSLAILTAEQKQLVRTEMNKPGAPVDLSEVIAKVFGIKEN
jgi:hypothetical protein